MNTHATELEFVGEVVCDIFDGVSFCVCFVVVLV